MVLDDLETLHWLKSYICFLQKCLRKRNTIVSQKIYAHWPMVSWDHIIYCDDFLSQPSRCWQRNVPGAFCVVETAAVMALNIKSAQICLDTGFQPLISRGFQRVGAAFAKAHFPNVSSCNRCESRRCWSDEWRGLDGTYEYFGINAASYCKALPFSTLYVRSRIL